MQKIKEMYFDACESIFVTKDKVDWKDPERYTKYHCIRGNKAIEYSIDLTNGERLNYAFASIREYEIARRNAPFKMDFPVGFIMSLFDMEHSRCRRIDSVLLPAAMFDKIAKEWELDVDWEEMACSTNHLAMNK